MSYLKLFTFIFTFTILISNSSPQTADSGTTEDSLFTSTQSTNLKSSRTDSCEGLDISVRSYTPEELSESRATYNNYLTNKADYIIEIINNEDYIKILDTDLIIFLITFILVILVFISSVIYFVNICLCCCTGTSDTNHCCIKCNLWLAVFGLVGFIAYCIALAFYIERIRTGLKNVSCSLKILPDDVINGYSGPPAFMGFFPFYTLLKNFKVDLDLIQNNYSNDVNAIFNLGLKENARSMLDSLSTFCVNCDSNKTPNGDGFMKTPFSASTDLDGTISSAEVEFEKIYQYCDRISTGITSIKTLIDNPDSETVQSSLDTLISDANSLTSKIDSVFSTLNKFFDLLNDVYDISQIVFLVFCFVCALIGFTLVLLLCYAVKNQHSSKFCCWRICIALLGFFSFIIIIYAFGVSLVTFATSMSCGLFQTIDTPDGISKFVTIFEMDNSTKTLIEKCFLEAEDGSIESLLSSVTETNSDNLSNFNNISNFINIVDDYGISDLGIESDKMSKSFKEYKVKLDAYASGNSEDHSNIFSTLNNLNTIVSCANESYFLNTINCQTNFTCKSLKTTNDYVAPSCQTDNQKNIEAGTIVNNLNKYINSTVNLTGNLSDKSYSLTTNPTTPNKFYFDMSNNIESVSSPMGRLSESMKSKGIKDANVTLMDNLNCNFIINHIHTIESTFCYEFSENMYTFMIISVIAGGFFFLFVWNLCCTLCCIERSRLYNEESKIHYADKDERFQNNSKVENYKN